MDFSLAILGRWIAFIESFAWLGNSSCILRLSSLDRVVQPLASALGLELKLTKYVLGLFLSFPLAAVMRLLPDKNLRHLYSLLGGLFLAQWIFEADWIHTFLTSTGTYLICALAPQKYQHLIAFVFVMG